MAGADMRWVPIATVFPAGLDTETAVQKLPDGFTPDGYGFDIEYPGRLVHLNAAQGSGNRYTARTYTIDGNDWTWFFRRLWRANGTNLEYNAPEYQDVVLYQDLGKLSCVEDGNSVVTFFPFGTNLFVGKATGGYILPGSISLDGDFQHADLEEQMKVSNALYATPLEQVPFVSNANGIYTWNGGAVQELTVNVRSSISYFANRQLRIDRPKRRLIGYDGTRVKFIYDTVMKKLFIYQDTNTDFRFTTRTISSTRPFPVRAVAFEFDNTTDARGILKFQTKLDKSDWRKEITVTTDDREEQYNRIRAEIDDSPQSHEFALRLTRLDPHIHIRAIYIYTNITTDEDSPSQ